MKKFFLALIMLGFACTGVQATIYRLVNNPDLCVVDYNDENRILDFSQCEIERKGFAENGNFGVVLMCEIRYSGSGSLGFVKMRSGEDVFLYKAIQINFVGDSTISMDVFDEILGEDGNVYCYPVVSGGFYHARQISSNEKKLKEKKAHAFHCATYSIEEEYYLMQTCINACQFQKDFDIVGECAKRLKEFGCKEKLNYDDARYKIYSCPIKKTYY